MKYQLTALLRNKLNKQRRIAQTRNKTRGGMSEDKIEECLHHHHGKHADPLSTSQKRTHTEPLASTNNKREDPIKLM